ncbi:hypothetical protein ACWD4F_21480 [Streptomyces aureus]
MADHVHRWGFLRGAGIIVLAAAGLFLTAGGVFGLVDDLALSDRFDSAAPCAGSDRDDLYAPCLHRVTAVVTSTGTEGRGGSVVRITLKGPAPVGGDVRLDDPPGAFRDVRSGDRVEVTVWAGTVPSMTVHGHTRRTEDAPETNLLIDAGLLIAGAAMSLGGLHMAWLWFFRREQLSDDLSEFKAVGGWVGGQCVLAILINALLGVGTLTVVLVLWGALTVPMSLYFWIKLRYD